MRPLKSDQFVPLSIDRLLAWILKEESGGSLFGIDRRLFFLPDSNRDIGIRRYGHYMETPIGVAAGPHSQLAQNIIAAWLTGARYIELKTIQDLDELKISKPCIDMADEGYNCEWSQELNIKQSYLEYLKAWILIHILRERYGWQRKGQPGLIFNMSVGYDLKGIRGEKVQWFLQKMGHCALEKEQMLGQLEGMIPGISKMAIPDRISDNITLSTMHGCPPEEIEKLGNYLIDQGYHTTIKLNPTLLGPEKLREILNNNLNFDVSVPDIAFEHDLKYPDAIQIIRNLTVRAKEKDVSFGLKLTNTLESLNIRKALPENEKMHYMSGRPLHPIAIQLASRLQREFNGMLDISFSAGADTFNIKDILSCGLMPVTICSDLLKPGGYGRLKQVIDAIPSLDSDPECAEKPEHRLHNYSERVINDIAYKRTYIKRETIKSDRKLKSFDCIAAPCQGNCRSGQDIPEYMFHASRGDFERAMAVIDDTNPLPLITGAVCTQHCALKCTRNHYDTALAIRQVKKTIRQNSHPGKSRPQRLVSKRVAVIGAGPSGMACAYYLAKAGVEVDLYEKNQKAGGMVRYAIPGFRLSDQDIKLDFQKILASDIGKRIRINYGVTINKTGLKKMLAETDFLYLSPGAPLSKKMGIPGESAAGVIESLDLLRRIKTGASVNVGNRVAVIGGGNTAMDIARSIKRIQKGNGRVQLLYRRRIEDMPADDHEIQALIREGIEIIELVRPLRVLSRDGKLNGLELDRMAPDGMDQSGRMGVTAVPDSHFSIELDTLIPAIGQNLSDHFIDPELLQFDPETGRIRSVNPKVMIGGDAEKGASSIVNGIGDGRRAALEMLNHFGIPIPLPEKEDKGLSYSDHMVNRATRIRSHLGMDDHDRELSSDEAITEASRCLYCDEICHICVTVCPNRANIAYETIPSEVELETLMIGEDGKASIMPFGHRSIGQTYQVLNIADFCNECGNCSTFCPTSGAPYLDKPKLSLSESSFNAESEAFLFHFEGESSGIRYKREGFFYTLVDLSDRYLCSVEGVEIGLSKNDFKIVEYRIPGENTTWKGEWIEHFYRMVVLLDHIPEYLKPGVRLSESY